MSASGVYLSKERQACQQGHDNWRFSFHSHWSNVYLFQRNLFKRCGFIDGWNEINRMCVNTHIVYIFRISLLFTQTSAMLWSTMIYNTHSNSICIHNLQILSGYFQRFSIVIFWYYSEKELKKSTHSNVCANTSMEC
jgi:hypothetical protein